MRRAYISFLALGIALLLVSGCGNGSSSHPSAQFFSSLAADGDIEQDNAALFHITQPGGLTAVLAGFDTTTGSEFRAFLDFPGTGTLNNTIIDSATLDLFIDDLRPLSVSSVPIAIDLLSFTAFPLLAGDFGATPVITKNSFILQSDVGRHVIFDVTALLTQAQLSGLTDFQLRIRQTDLTGLVTIHRGAAGSNFSPFLDVLFH